MIYGVLAILINLCAAIAVVTRNHPSAAGGLAGFSLCLAFYAGARFGRLR